MQVVKEQENFDLLNQKEKYVMMEKFTIIILANDENEERPQKVIDINFTSKGVCKFCFSFPICSFVTKIVARNM